MPAQIQVITRFTTALCGVDETSTYSVASSWLAAAAPADLAVCPLAHSKPARASSM
jgi:hypothetical protein